MATKRNVTQTISPVVAVAQQMAQGDIYTTSSGVRVRFKPVALRLMSRIANEVPEPAVPMWFNEEKGREEPNPAHPDYERERQAVDAKRVEMTLDTVIMWGVELVDGLPADESWVEMLELTGVPVGESKIAREFAYKRFVAIVSTDDIQELMANTVVGREQVEAAEGQFRR